MTRYFTPNLLVYYGIVVPFPSSPPSPSLLMRTASVSSRRARSTRQLPVVTELPHAWFPRTYYSPTPAQYIFPLDWDVVLRFPRKERNNAVDFHIMQRFQRITGIPTILPTAQLIERQKEFYVLNERSRAWLDNLRGRYQLHETVVGSSSSCALVRVRVTDAPARAVL